MTLLSMTNGPCVSALRICLSYFFGRTTLGAKENIAAVSCYDGLAYDIDDPI